MCNNNPQKEMILISVYYSELLGLYDEIDELGAFDPLLDIDSNYFINIKLLKGTNINEFKDSYNNVNERFRQIGLLLNGSKQKGDKLFSAAYKLFDFPEANGISLGYSKSTRGSGMGKKLRYQTISDAFEMVQNGSIEPEIFHLVQLFEVNVGPDRISDMIASLIYNEILAYTRRINRLMEINEENYPELVLQNGLVKNPYKEEPILLLPKNIIHELPIAEGWDDVSRVCSEIEKIRVEINIMIGKEWSKMSIRSKKNYFRDQLINRPSVFRDVIDKYRELEIEEYDFQKDKIGEYYITRNANNLARRHPLTIGKEKYSNYKIVLIILEKFKDLIENNKGYELLYYKDKSRNEKSAQRLLFCIASSYCESNNLDISPEVDAGRGQLDFKFSKGNEKVLVEMKLSTNPDLIHGYEVQLKEYSKAEKSKNLIYLVIDNGGSEKKIDRLVKLHCNVENSNIHLFIVDAKPKKSASQY